MQDRYSNIPNHLKEFIVSQDYDDYTAIDHACWRFIMEISKRFFKDHAHDAYLGGLRGTGITINSIPKISDMDDKLQEIGWRAVPVRGFLPPTIFMQFQAHSILPIASDMRTAEHMTYTPAPDIVHEAAGHSPIIVDEDYSKFLKKYGACAVNALYSNEDHEIYLAIRRLSDIKENPGATPEDIKEAEENLQSSVDSITFISEAAYLARLNWWTVEYGLVGEMHAPRIYGAGLLSSVGESYNAIHGNVKKIPLSLDCINYSYDITEQQPQLFVARDFDHLSVVLSEFTNKMAFARGGIKSIQQAIKCKSVCTFKLDSGLQVSGVPSEVIGEDKEQYYIFSGPVQLSCNAKQLDGHGGEYHRSGFSSPLCSEDIIKQIQTMETDDKVNLDFGGGIQLTGTLSKKLILKGKLLVASFSDCTITRGDRVLFDPSWGTFDLACGSAVASVSGGPADMQTYIKHMQMELPNKNKPDYLVHHSQKEENLIDLYHEVQAMKGQSVFNKDAIKMILAKIDLLFPKEWLLRFQLLEILNSHSQTDLCGEIESKILSIADGRKDLLSSIKRGISQLNSSS
jgi:phenylalanine-4-hydroxylase